MSKNYGLPEGRAGGTVGAHPVGIDKFLEVLILHNAKYSEA